MNNEDRQEAITKTYENMFGNPSGPVFNGHSNDADSRARTLMQVVCPTWLEEVVQLEEEKNGIMGIFDAEPTPAIAAYVMLVNAFVLKA
tara:strand:+ start:65 stop:331 length:267 start_codon:yes stop_codon:yes gene_type:complete